MCLNYKFKQLILYTHATKCTYTTCICRIFHNTCSFSHSYFYARLAFIPWFYAQSLFFVFRVCSYLNVCMSVFKYRMNYVVFIPKIDLISNGKILPSMVFNHSKGHFPNWFLTLTLDTLISHCENKVSCLHHDIKPHFCIQALEIWCKLLIMKYSPVTLSQNL